MLALAVAELIATSRLEHTPGRPITTPVAPVARRATLLWLGAGVVRAFEPTQWLPALAVGAAHSFGPIALAGDVGYEWTGRELETARVTANDVSLGLALQLHILQGVLAWRVGPGVRVGYAWLAAAARTDALHGGKLSGWFMAPMLQSMLELRLTARWSLQLALELGYIAKPLRGLDADSAALLQLRGLRMSGQLGVGFAL
jgi:hypothetical protein